MDEDINPLLKWRRGLVDFMSQRACAEVIGKGFCRSSWNNWEIGKSLPCEKNEKILLIFTRNKVSRADLRAWQERNPCYYN